MLEAIDIAAGLFALDIGGEGRHPNAWNLNPRRKRSVRGAAGQPIPRLIVGRGESIPLADGSVDVLIVERTPLSRATLAEMVRVAKPAGTAILRHAITPGGDPHRIALGVLRGTAARRTTSIGGVQVRETVIEW